jgi:hypothetical protein
VAYRDSTSTYVSGTSINATKPALTRANDTLYAYLLSDNAGDTFTVPSGWFLVPNTVQSNASSSPDGFQSSVYQKLAGAQEPATYNFTKSGTATDFSVHIITLSGRSPSAPVIVHGTLNTTGNSTPVTVTDSGVTALQDDDVIIFSTGDITVNTDTWSFTAVPANYTQRLNDKNGFNVITSVTRDGVVAGATGNLSLTLTRSAGTGVSGWGIIVLSVAAGRQDVQLAKPIMFIGGLNWTKAKIFQPELPVTGIPNITSLDNTPIQLPPLIFTLPAFKLKFLPDFFVTPDQIITGAAKIIITDVGALTITGFAPVIKKVILPSFGQLIITGQPPVIKKIIITGVGSLTVTGFAPIFKKNIVTGIGSLTVTGFVPKVNKTIISGLGQLTITGLAPKIAKIIIPGTGSLLLTGKTPTKPIVTSLGQLILTGQVPFIAKIILVNKGQLIITGLAPVINRIIKPNFGQLILTGFTPVVNKVIKPATGSLIITGFAPTFSTSHNILPGTGQLILNGQAPTINKIIKTATGSLSIIGFAPVKPKTITIGSGQLVLIGYSPVLVIPIIAGTGHLIITGFEPTIRTTGGRVIQTQTGELILTGFEPSFFTTVSLRTAGGMTRAARKKKKINNSLYEFFKALIEREG